MLAEMYREQPLFSAENEIGMLKEMYMYTPLDVESSGLPIRMLLIFTGINAKLNRFMNRWRIFPSVLQASVLMD